MYRPQFSDTDTSVSVMPLKEVAQLIIMSREDGHSSSVKLELPSRTSQTPYKKNKVKTINGATSPRIPPTRAAC
jgi:hypothetical protein